MPEHFHGEWEMPLGDRAADVPTPEEYAAALAELARFSSHDISTVGNLSQLRSALGTVGQSLRHVVQALGEVQTTDFSFRKPGETSDTPARDRAKVLRHPMGEYELFVVGEGPKGVVCMALIPGTGHQLFMANVPAEPIDRHGEPTLDMIRLGAVDHRGGSAVGYYPLMDPHNSETCQGYARLVQEFTKDVASLATN